MIFRHDEYIKFLTYMKDVGNIVTMKDWDGSNAIILRHDVDFDIDPAYKMAIIEYANDVRSTFFILTTCEYYNPCSLRNREMLLEMVAMGFEIGLHFDASLYKVSELTSCVAREASILSSIIDKPIHSISLHNPSMNGQYPLFYGYRNAYDEKIFNHDCYLSDSLMSFRGKDPYEFVLMVKQYPIQLLLHPIHYSQEGGTYQEIFCERLKAYIDSIDNDFQDNATYKRLRKTDLFTYMKESK